MSFHEVGFLIGFGFLFRFAEFLDQAHGFAFKAAIETAAGAGVHDVAELCGREVKESVQGGGGVLVYWSLVLSGGERDDKSRKWIDILVKVDATVGKFAEGSLLLDLCCRL